MNFLTLQPLTEDMLPAAIALDQRCFGGLWTADGYRRELDSPYSDLLVLQEAEGNREQGMGNREQGMGNRVRAEDRMGTGGEPADPSSFNSHSELRTQNSELLGLGCLWAILEEAHITILAIHPDYQRQGLGQFLLYRLLIAAWQRQLEWVTLEVRVSNQAAIALYQKFDFEIVGKRRHYYPDTGEDALILWRSGVQKPEFHNTLRIKYQEVRDRLLQAGWHLSEDDIHSNFCSVPLDASPFS